MEDCLKGWGLKSKGFEKINRIDDKYHDEGTVGRNRNDGKDNEEKKEKERYLLSYPDHRVRTGIYYFDISSV